MIQTNTAYREALDLINDCMGDEHTWTDELDELVNLVCEYEEIHHPLDRRVTVVEESRCLCTIFPDMDCNRCGDDLSDEALAQFE